MSKLLYSCYLLTSKGKEAISQFTSDLPNKFAHHCTIEFMPDKPLEQEGNITSIFAYGRLKTDLVDTLLISGRLLPIESKNDYAHITLSTAKEIKPFISNTEIIKHMDKSEFITMFDNPIEIETVITNIYS